MKLEDKLKEAVVWREAYRRYYEQERDKNRELQEQIRDQKLEWRAEVARLKTEIEELKQKRSPAQNTGPKPPPAQNTDPKPPQEDSVVKPRSGFFSRFSRKSQCSSITSLLADLSHLSDRECRASMTVNARYRAEQ